MPLFLSPEWFEAARGPVPATAEAEADSDFVILEQVVHGGPGGTVVYRVHAGNGRAVIEWPVADTSAEPDLRITSDWDTAAAVASGDLSTQRALMQGRLKLSGNPTGLGARIEALSGIDPVEPELRKATTFTASGVRPG